MIVFVASDTQEVSALVTVTAVGPVMIKSLPSFATELHKIFFLNRSCRDCGF